MPYRITGNRKFFALVLGFSTTAILVALGRLDGMVYRDVFIGLATVFAAGNAAEWYAQRGKE